MVSKVLNAKQMAREVKLSAAGLSKAARLGKFGRHAHRDERKRWLFDMPGAAEEFARRTDQTRLPAAKIEQRRTDAAASSSYGRTHLAQLSVIYESERGRLEVSLPDFAIIERSCNEPEAAILDERLAGILAEIVRITTPDFTPREIASLFEDA